MRIQNVVRRSDMEYSIDFCLIEIDVNKLVVF